MLPCVLVSCAGSFDRNASVLRALAVSRWYSDRGMGGYVSLTPTGPNRDLAGVFGVAPDRFVSLAAVQAGLAESPPRFTAVHLVNVSVKNLVLAMVVRAAGGRVIADWDEWATKIPAPLARTCMWWVSEVAMFATADFFVVASRFLQRELGSFKRLKRVLYIPYGFRPAAVEAKAPLDLPKGDYVAYVGSFASNYVGDLAEIVKCGRCLKRRGWTLLLIGDGVLLPALQADLAREGIPVCCAGRMLPQEVDALLRAPEILAGFLPLESTRQNLARCPNKIFHYIKASLPVVTNRIGEAEAALGDLGCYYEWATEDSLAVALGQAATGRVRYRMESYSWDARFSALRPWLDQLTVPATVL